MRESRPSAVPRRAGHTDVRRNNLEVVLRHLAADGSISRAGLAGRTGLTRATVSRLVAELIDLGLVREGARSDSGRSGRPSTPLELDGRHVVALGVEVNVDYLAILALDLAGREVHREERVFDAVRAGPDASVDALTGLCRDTLRRLGRRRHERPLEVVGLAIAVPGLVDVASGVVAEAPNLHWRDVAVGEPLRAQLGLGGIPIDVGNDANFAALAEYRIGRWAGTADLVYVTGEVGIGGGVVVGGRQLLGARGFGGEVGHMQVHPDGPVCGCGRRGCWEALIGLAALLRAAGIRSPRNATPRRRLDELLRRAEAGDARTGAALDQLGRDIGAGAAVLANVLDPDVIILGGYFVALERWIVERAQQALAAGVLAPRTDVATIGVSALGFTAAARGAAIHALERVVSDPTILLTTG